MGAGQIGLNLVTAQSSVVLMERGFALALAIVHRPHTEAVNALGLTWTSMKTVTLTSSVCRAKVCLTSIWV